MEGVIYFYDKKSDLVKEEHIFLNNYEPSPIVVDSFTYQSVEHFYHCHKFDNFDENPEFQKAFDEIR